MLDALLTGLTSGFLLIIAIGAQNAVVLRQGLARNYIFETCLFCALSDTIFITCGVLGFSILIDIFPNFSNIFTLLGAIFLLYYSGLRLRAVFTSDYKDEISGKAQPLMRVIGVLFAVTWLNPHVYVDTFALLGAISTRYPNTNNKIAFALGAIIASFIFFFSLGYGAKFLAPLMRSAKTWRILDSVIAVFMIGFAIVLLTFH